MFNTSLFGYQEIMTDPSYAGQMVCFTATQIGNTGVNEADMESSKAWLDGAIVRSLSPLVSNYRSEATLQAFCEAQGVVGIAEVDTRALTRRIREAGAMPGVICTDPSVSTEALLAQAKGWTLDGKDMISVVSTKQQYTWAAATDAEWAFGAYGLAPPKDKPYRVVAYDFGIKRNILRRLASYGCETVVVPADTSAAAVFAMRPDGVFLSNGPGDPSAVPYAVVRFGLDVLVLIPLLDCVFTPALFPVFLPYRPARRSSSASCPCLASAWATKCWGRRSAGAHTK